MLQLFNTSPKNPKLFGIKYGYGPAAPSIAAELNRTVAMPPQVTEDAAFRFWNDFNAGSPNDFNGWRNAANDFYKTHLVNRLAHALDAETGFGERLVQFWADHFTQTTTRNQMFAMQTSFIDEAIRKNLLNFTNMLNAVELHTAMIMFLNQDVSVGEGSVINVQTPERGLNENLAREILELHTVGVESNYTQDDVRAAANLLAGIVIRPYRRQVGYEVERAAPTTQRILGVDYPENSIDEIKRWLSNLAVLPDTAKHLCYKLVNHFVADDPPEHVVNYLANIYLQNNGNLLPVYEAMEKILWVYEQDYKKTKQPFDWVISCLKSLDITGADIRSLGKDFVWAEIINPMDNMGQKWNGQTGPDGWGERETDWLSPSQLSSRIVWALNFIPKVFVALGRPVPDVQTVFLNSFVRNEPAEAHVYRWANLAQTPVMGITSIFVSDLFSRR